MVHQQYRGLSPAEVDEVWRRMRAGHAMKPTARALGCRPALCAPTWCGVGGSDQSPGVGHRSG